MKEKNIYEKIQIVKSKLLEANIKKSGLNRFANYSYYELADLTPYIIKFCKEVGLFTQITFANGDATLIIRNIDKPEEFEQYVSPMKELELKGCNQIQALGGVETYSRRYLYLSAFDIIENDMFDSVVSEEEKIEIPALEDEILVGEMQVEKIKELVEDIPALLLYYNIDKLEELTMLQAKNIIKLKSKEKKEVF